MLASRLDKVPQPPGASIPKPSLTDVAAQAGAHFVGVPRAGGAIALYLVVCGLLALVGLVTLARAGAARAVLVVAWIVLPLGVLAVVRIPNSDNHVRYVIEALPLAGIAIAYGAWTLGRYAGWRGAVAAALAAAALVAVVEGTRGARLSDYRYRGDSWAAPQGRPRHRRGLSAGAFHARRPVPGLRRGVRRGRARPRRQPRALPRPAAPRARSPR